MRLLKKRRRKRLIPTTAIRKQINSSIKPYKKVSKISNPGSLLSWLEKIFGLKKI